MDAEPRYPDFPREEFDHRYRLARQLMDEHGLDALLVTGRHNYMWFTGLRSQNPADKARPYVLLLPRHRDPICFVMSFQVAHVKQTTWVRDARTHQLLKHNDVIEQAIRELGLAKGRIGCELGREQYLGMSYDSFNELKARLSEASFVDAAEILLQLRLIKSPAEVERCRKTAGIVARALDRAFDHVKAGMTNQEVAHLVRRLIIEGGCEQVTNMAISSGYDFSREMIMVPTPRVLEVGDTLTVDIGAEAKGYSCDICRTVVIGKATQPQQDMYKLVIELNYKCYEAIRPGNYCEDVALTCARELERLGRKTQGAGRIGHGVGCEALEFPSLAVGERVRLEPGMILTCNPNFLTEYGYFNSEENLVVTETGHAFLSDPVAPHELRVVG